jgi:hypothetical protein
VHLGQNGRSRARGDLSGSLGDAVKTSAGHGRLKGIARSRLARVLIPRLDAKGPDTRVPVLWPSFSDTCSTRFGSP